MKILKVLGQVGAVAAAGVGLILAGKSGFGSDLFSSKDEDGVATDDLTTMPEQTEQTSEETETTATEEEETPE